MLISTGVRLIHAVEFGEEQSQRSMSTRGQVGCPAVEKLASLQQGPGRLHVETWAGRDGNPSLSDFPGGGNHAGVCRYGDLPSSFLSFLPCHLDRAEKCGME